MLAVLSKGRTEISNFCPSDDCQSTLECLRQLGAQIRVESDRVWIEGLGLGRLRSPPALLDARNSGTTVRLLSGIVAGNPITATFSGDASLSRRPMRRILEPLKAFGANVHARDDEYLPMTITGGALRAVDYQMPFASAQVKSAVLLAGLHATGRTFVREPGQSRNHTELLLQGFGARIRVTNDGIMIDGEHDLLSPGAIAIPGDVSSAAFIVAAALIVPGSDVEVQAVGLNPTRVAFLDVLERAGGAIHRDVGIVVSGELCGSIRVRFSELSEIDIGEAEAPRVIDEIPILAVIGARSRNGIRVRGARELRFKESDRIRTIVDGLRAIGVSVAETDDGFDVPGEQAFQGGLVRTEGDHRIAMAFGVAGLASRDAVVIDDPDCVSVSFPGFFEVIDQLAGRAGTVPVARH